MARDNLREAFPGLIADTSLTREGRTAEAEADIINKYEGIRRDLGYYGILIPPYKDRVRISLPFIKSLISDTRLTDITPERKVCITGFLEACMA